LSKLDYQCTAPGFVVAKASGMSTSNPQSLDGQHGTVLVQDENCAELVKDFLDCTPTGSGSGGGPGGGGSPGSGGGPGSGGSPGSGGYAGNPAGGSGGTGSGGSGGFGSSGSGGTTSGNSGVDIGGVDFNVSVGVAAGQTTASGTPYQVTICVNESGDVGDYIQVANTGNVTLSQSFDVAIGLFRDQDQQVFPASDLLNSKLVLNPGEAALWSGPFCTTVDIVKKAGQTYRLFVYADASDDVSEVDEDNNYALTDPLTF